MHSTWSGCAKAVLACAACLPPAVLGGTTLARAVRQAAGPAISVSVGPDGRLVYRADARGNRVIDFSHAGYGGGGQPIPDVPARILVGPGRGNDGDRIQAALDLLSSMPADHGIRGAVLLEAGTYTIDDALRIAAGGVVLRGAGDDEHGTVLVAGGTSRRSLLVVSGHGERVCTDEPPIRVADAYVPAGATTFSIEGAGRLAAGDRIVIRRPSTASWIALLGMNTFQGWRPENRLHWQSGSRDVAWDRAVTAVDGNRVTIDAPITTALDSEYGGGLVSRCSFPGRIGRTGVENLRLVSAFDPGRPMDEDHSWDAITLDKVENAWVRGVTAVHFAGSAVNVRSDAKAVTVENVNSLDPVSEAGGYRRRAFLASGQLTLFRGCRSERGRNDFAVGFAAAGPNVFLDDTAIDALDFSGALESWASGVLYDNVKIRGNALKLTNRGTANQGAGWAAANSVLWNSEATDIEVQSPPGAVNQAYGCKGMAAGDGIVWDPRAVPYRDFYRGMPVEPRSLYLAQLAERLGPDAVRAIAPRAVQTSPGEARRLSEADVQAFVKRRRERLGPSAGPLRIEGGTFKIDGRPAWTTRVSYSWFQGQMPPSLARAFGPAITRFAPGLDGPGLTDDLEEAASGMKPGSVFYQHYGLWYDRRRVDHNYYGSPEQRTGDVWAPFMELPWARSGRGKAWDGLSKYDLRRFNPWYFERVKAFADIADRKGLVLHYSFYFQHWLLESRSHYVDFPWRPANAIQETGLPDEVPAARAFYDVSHPLRRELHRLYISHVLDTIGRNTNVVFGIDREYTGSLAFVRFWLDTIAEWQRVNGRKVFVSLEIPKDQMDAILADPERRRLVSAVDFHGWLYRADGRPFVIRGDIDRSPREQRPDIATAEEIEALKRTLVGAALDQKDYLNGPEFQKLFDNLWAGSKPMQYRAWREYRDRFPDLVILTAADHYPTVTRSVEANIPEDVRSRTVPADLVRTNRDTAWSMARPGETYIVYSMSGKAVEIDLAGDPGVYSVLWLDPERGTIRRGSDAVNGGRLVSLAPPESGMGGTARPWVAWLSVAKGPDNGARGAVTWRLDNLQRIGGHRVTIEGTPRVAETEVGPAVEFNGKTDGLFIEANPLTGLERFTIEVVFNPAEDGQTEQRFFHAEETSTGNRALLETRVLPDGSWCLDTFLRHGDQSLTLLDRARSHRAGAWHVAALTFDGRTMTAFVDGVKELSGDVVFRALGPGRTSIGVRQNKVSHFKGLIALVRITPEALAAGQLMRRLER
ncbi:MAG: DUF6298 domain-containing protein [Vicinamibacterales bacterium]